MSARNVSLKRLLNKYDLKKKITMVTAWDSLTAHFIEKSRVDCLLVGDSLSMTALGYSSTLPVTLNDMIYHTKAVARVAKRPFIISDIPFSAMNNPVEAAIRLMQNGAHSVKIEGANEVLHDSIRKLGQIGVPVLGHLGLNPQHVNKLGGYHLYKDGGQLLKNAMKLKELGCWGIVIEAVPSELAKRVQAEAKLPLIGIGAGQLDGQVLVFSDLVGLNDRVPKFCRVMAKAGAEIDSGLESFCESVESESFPSEEEEYKLK
eukprot:NODE_185_length_15706_cov_0.275902.p5 type:complete len:261 gc:universal NODE_185_length_15706_cov_0.275902:992-1774(+)